MVNAGTAIRTKEIPPAIRATTSMSPERRPNERRVASSVAIGKVTMASGTIRSARSSVTSTSEAPRATIAVSLNRYWPEMKISVKAATPNRNGPISSRAM